MKGTTVRGFAADHGLTAQVERLHHSGLSAAQIQLVLDCPVEWSSKLVGTLGFAFRRGLIRLNDLMLPGRPHQAELHDINRPVPKATLSSNNR